MTTTPIKRPIDNLPCELLHMVCTHLKPTEVANLRLASRAVAPIGLQYLVPQVHLVVAEDSFKQLETIARHPVASKYVTSLFYEADTLQILDRKEWKEQVKSPDYYDRFQMLWEAPCPRYLLRSYKGEVAQTRSIPSHHHNKQQLNEAFSKHQEFCDFQGRAKDSDSSIATAMRNLPNLKELTMSTRVLEHTQAFKNAFAPACCTVYREDVEEWPIGWRQMRSLLLGACHANLKIERLRCRQVNWLILAQRKETFEEMKGGVRHLRQLSITFSTQGLDDIGILDFENVAGYFQEGRLNEFVASAPNLERLEICFVWTEAPYTADFKHVVGDFYWPFLKAVKFEVFETTEDQLVGFLERHASTMKDVCIGSLILSHGRWWSVFERMRRVLNLDTVEISDSLESDWGLLEFEQRSEHEQTEQAELRKGIESYLLGGTDQRISLNQFLLDFLGDGSDSIFWDLPAVPF